MIRADKFKKIGILLLMFFMPYFAFADGQLGTGFALLFIIIGLIIIFTITGIISAVLYFLMGKRKYLMLAIFPATGIFAFSLLYLAGATWGFDSINALLFLISLLICSIIISKFVKENPTKSAWYVLLSISLLLMHSCLYYFSYKENILILSFIYAIISFLYGRAMLQSGEIIKSSRLYLNISIICLLSFLASNFILEASRTYLLYFSQIPPSFSHLLMPNYYFNLMQGLLIAQALSLVMIFVTINFQLKMNYMTVSFLIFLTIVAYTASFMSLSVKDKIELINLKNRGLSNGQAIDCLYFEGEGKGCGSFRVCPGDYNYNSTLLLKHINSKLENGYKKIPMTCCRNYDTLSFEKQIFLIEMCWGDNYTETWVYSLNNHDKFIAKQMGYKGIKLSTETNDVSDFLIYEHRESNGAIMAFNGQSFDTLKIVNCKELKEPKWKCWSN